MNLSENAFAVLGASPADDREILAVKADEAALLLGRNDEEAFHKLMQMNRRISAEISWLPGTSPEAAQGFLAYSCGLAEGKTVELPDLESLGTPLAQANALSMFFESWPAYDPELLIGLCRSMDRILSQISFEETFRIINADREAGKWEPIQDLQDILEPMYAHLRELCRPVIRAAEGMEQEALSHVICTLCRDETMDISGDVIQELRQVYEIRFYEQAEELKEEIISLTKKRPGGIFGGKVDGIAVSFMQKLQEEMEKWYRLMQPLQFFPGSARDDARVLGIEVIKCISHYFNNASPEAMLKTVEKESGKVTLRYYSKKKAALHALDMLTWERRLYAKENHDEVLKVIEDLEGQINKIMSEEVARVELAERNA